MNSHAWKGSRLPESKIAVHKLVHAVLDVNISPVVQARSRPCDPDTLTGLACKSRGAVLEVGKSVPIGRLQRKVVRYVPKLFACLVSL